MYSSLNHNIKDKLKNNLFNLYIINFPLSLKLFI